MSLTFGFYNSKNHDRRYNAIQMSSIFDGIINDGIFMTIGTCFRVVVNSGMMVNVGIGRAWFDHTWTLNDAPYPITLPLSELILNRIDAIVLEVNAEKEVRANSLKVIKGTPSSNPVRPTLTNTKTIHQYPLAYISVTAKTSEIRTADITNMVGSGSCPFVTGPLETINIEMMVAQWEDQWKRFYEKTTADMTSTNQFWKDQWKQFYTSQTTAIQESYKVWDQQWNEFFNQHKDVIIETEEYWKELWQKWFYDYVNNSSRELAYWKKLVVDDYNAYSDFWKAEWEKWFRSQTTAIQESYLNWQKEWEDFYSRQTTEIQEANDHWKDLWDTWFMYFVNSSTEEFSNWRITIDREFKTWWDSIKEYLEDVDVSRFAEELVALDSRVTFLEQFRKDLLTDRCIYDALDDSMGGPILDSAGDQIFMRGIMFISEEMTDLDDAWREIGELKSSLSNVILNYNLLLVRLDFMDKKDSEMESNMLILNNKDLEIEDRILAMNNKLTTDINNLQNKDKELNEALSIALDQFDELEKHSLIDSSY